ncbi:hypothetical protein CC86DRAFT_294177 [Ophiobolus disseminans]|uniref:DUF4211 domain-containing protein n=1 Tax=Ophiobolus disseminans TaxID=1469910 RepID=A0A6A6ZZF5_9PLEO|nr:hypothetical protein CC86DRAFT_294177 [Ophiobolus disseminans]
MAKKARDRKRQTKISFSPAAKSSQSTMGATPSKSAMATPTSASKAAPARSTPSRLRKGSKKTAVDSSSEDELAGETHRGMSQGMPVATTEHGMFGSSDKEADLSNSEQEDEEEEAYAKPKLASRKRRRGQDSSEPEGEEQRKGKGKAKVTVIRTKRSRRRSPTPELSDDEELRLPPSKRIKVTRRQRTPDDDDEDEDDVIEKTPPRSRRRKAARREPTPDEEEDVSPPRSRRRKASKRQSSRDVPKEPTSPRSRRRKEARRPIDEADNGAVSATEDNESEREELQEELAFLQSSPVANRGKLRSEHDKPKNERQRALEALKKKRAGTSEPSSSATPGRARRVVIDSDSDSELEVIKEEVESDLEVISDPNNDVEEDEEEPESDRDANALDMFLEDEDDAGFIDNDADALIGEPILGPDDFMPLVMQRIASSKPKELFNHAIEWMVMKKIHPAFDSNSQIYNMVFRKLDDEVKGLANSKFSSSAWTPDFTRAIRARPDLMSMDISIGKSEVMEMHCEACNRRNHPASAELMFTGQPYNPETLEPLDNDTDSDNSGSDNGSELSAASEVDANGEKPAYNAGGERLPPESKRFALGRTCRANAQVAHTLHHWRYHLYSWVKDYLARQGYLSAEMLVKRDSWTDKKREKAALKIVKGMEDNGEVRKLYHLYKDQVTYAVDVRHDLDGRWGHR